MSVDEQYVALPKLYGAPAYARPSRSGDDTPRPFDPDEMPIEADRTDDERALAASLPPGAFRPGGVGLSAAKVEAPSVALRPRAFSLKSLAGRIRSRD